MIADLLTDYQSPLDHLELPRFSIPGGAMVCCLMMTGTASSELRYEDLSKRVPSTATAAQFDMLSAADSTVTADRLRPVDAVEAVFAAYGLKPDRAGVTNRSSKMYQFFGGTHGCVDVYPNGKVIVLIDQGEHDDMYRFDASNGEAIVKVLIDADVRGRV